MLELIMKPDGELFIKTSEAEHSLKKRLNLAIEKGPPPPPDAPIFYALSEDLLCEVLWFFDLHLEELLDYEYAPHQSKFALGLVRKTVLSSIEAMVQDSVTYKLLNYNVTGFMFLDTEQASQ